jgi:mannose-6-phosphate isomerase-like protein (cupin superfamily)
VTEAVIRADGPVSERAGARSTLLADVEEIAAAEVRGEPGTAPPPPPYVSRHTESFYVLEGEMALTIGDRELRARAGSWAQVPPGVAHCISFPGPEPARVLELRTPGRGSDGFQPAPRTGA